MNQTKSSNDKTNIGIGKAMRPLWRAGIPATMALSALVAIVFAVAIDGCSSSSKSNKTTVSTGTSSTSGGASGTSTCACSSTAIAHSVASGALRIAA